MLEVKEGQIYPDEVNVYCGKSDLEINVAQIRNKLEQCYLDTYWLLDYLKQHDNDEVSDLATELHSLLIKITDKNDQLLRAAIKVKI